MKRTKHAPRSPIWAYYIRNENGGSCKVCGKFLKAANTTSTFITHLRLQHPDRWVEISHHYPKLPFQDRVKEPKKDAKPSTTKKKKKASANTEVAMKIELGEATLDPMSGDFFYAPPEPQSPQPPVAPETPTPKKKKVKRDPISTDSLIYYIVVDEMPINLTELPGFRHYSTSNKLPEAELPTQLGLRNMLEMKFNELSMVLKGNMEMSNGYCSLAISEWTDALSTRNFIGVTCHFIQESELKSAMIGFEEPTEAVTEDHLIQKIEALCDLWYITKAKVESVVVPGASPTATLVATTIFGADKVINCFAHVLNSIAKKPLEELLEVHSIIDAIKQITDHLKQGDEIMVEDYEDGQQFWDLIYATPTTWRGLLNQMEHFVKFSDKIEAILYEQPDAPSMLSEEAIHEIKDTIKVFKPLMGVVDELMLEDHLSASKVIPLVQCLLAALEGTWPETQVGIVTKQLIVDQINAHFAGMEDNEIFAITTLMDPRFKRNYFKKAHARDIATAKLKELVTVSKDSLEEDADDDGGIWSFRSSFVGKQASGSPHPISVYLSSKALPLKSNPILHFASLNVDLRSTAENLLVAMASTAPPQKIFSEAGNSIHSNWSSLPIHDLRRLMFLKSVTN